MGNQRARTDACLDDVVHMGIKHLEIQRESQPPEIAS